MKTIKSKALETVKELDQFWDPSFHMVMRNTYTHHHHTLFTPLAYRQDVHMPRENLYYAEAMMDTEDPFYFARGCEIMEEVIKYQETDPNDSECGSWSWYAEERASAMLRPDANWADFCGNCIVRTYIKHGDRMPQSLRNAIRPCLVLACQKIIRRDTPPNYTNIAALGASTVMLTGEVFGETSFVDYAVNRLRKINDFVKKIGTFEEYNSPTYYFVTLSALERIYLNTKNSDAKRLSWDLIDMLWKEIAQHFHPASKQWSGPHSRCYKCFDGFSLITLQNSTQLDLGAPFSDMTELDGWKLIRTMCPDEYLHWFTDGSERIIQDTYNKGNGVDQKAYQYINGDLSLGTFSCEHLWEQRTDLILYTLNKGKPVYAVIRAKIGDEHFSGAVFTSAQDKKRVVFGINLTADTQSFGITPKEGLIKGELETDYIGIELEIGGNLEGIEVTESGGKFALVIDGKPFYLDFLACGFDPGSPSFAIKRDADMLRLCCVLYNGPEIKHNLNALKQGWFLFSFACHEPFAVSVKTEGDRASATFDAEGKTRGIDIAVGIAESREKAISTNRSF